MRHQLKKLLKYGLALVMLILSSCEKDLYENPPPTAAAPFEKKYLNIGELPVDFQNYLDLNNSQSTARSNSSSDNLSTAIFMTHDIISMTDDKNITNYSISFFYPDTPENIYYNLVINVLPTGESTKYIFKYICNPADFENFKAHNFNFKYFVGITEISPVKNNTTTNFTSKSTSDDDDCPKIYVPSSSDLAANPGASGGGGGGTPGSGGFNTDVPGYNSPPSSGGYTGGGNGSSGHDHSGCYGSNGDYWYSAGDVMKPHSHTGKSSGNCPEIIPPAGNVPVNTMPMIKIIGIELSLAKDQIMYLRDHPDTTNLMHNYLTANDFSEDSKNFTKEIINQNILNPDMHFDIFASSNSPMNIDKSTITNETPEGKKFNTIFNALANSAEFKKLFIDIFGNSSRFNVKFEINDHVYEDNNPSKKEVNATTSQISGTNNIVIKINKQILISGINQSQTNIENAKTILHECIHAYLFVKSNNPAIGADFVKILNTMYPTLNEQHDFMYGMMVPTMQKVLSEIRDLVTTTPKRILLEDYTMHPTISPPTSTPFNWLDFYKFLSLNGLQETKCFIQDFPFLSNKYDLYKQYINAGNNELDR